MEIIEILPSGKITTKKSTKKSISEHFGIHIRDLRPVFLPRQLFTISVRGECIVMNIGNIKGVIGKEKAFMIPVNQEKSTKIFCSRIEKKIIKTEDSLPFEIQILEDALQVILEQVSSQYEQFEKKLNQTLQVIRNTPSQQNLETLLTLKTEIARMEKTTLEIQSALEEVLDEEEKMEDIFLSKDEITDFSVDDVESVLDNLLEQVLEIANKTAEKKENIDDTQEIVNLKLSAIRNTIIQFDLIATISTAILAIGTLISGFYGMNLKNYSENSDSFFFLMIGGVILFSLALFISLLKYMRKRNILH